MDEGKEKLTSGAKAKTKTTTKATAESQKKQAEKKTCGYFADSVVKSMPIVYSLK